MSLSKERLLAAAPGQQPREAKCSRCRHHGIIVPKKGHMKLCPFLRCDCWKCYLITQRTQIAALQRSQKRAQNKGQSEEEQRPGVSVVKPAAEGVCTAATPHGDACPSATSGMKYPTSGTTPERTPATTRSPVDLLSRPAAGGETVAGLDSGVLPFSSSDKGICPHAPFFGEFGQTAPLPIHFPFRTSGHHLSSYLPCPNFLFPNMPWLPPLPAGLYSDGLCGPLMFPHFPHYDLGAMHYPPPLEPRPPADCREVFVTLQPPPLPETLQELPQPPLSNTEDRRAALKHERDDRGTTS